MLSSALINMTPWAQIDRSCKERGVQPVRRRITELLKEHGTATVAELARQLDMAQVSVRHHLDILVGEDLVELSGVRRQNSAGRPSLVYSLTPNALKLFPQHHDALASAILIELKSTLPGSEVQRFMQSIGEKTARQAPAASPDQTLEERLDEVTDFLCRKGYGARWEERNGYYEIHTNNCPYSGVSDEHSEVCSMDQAMMNQLLPKAIRVQSRALDGALHCIYVVAADHVITDHATAAEKG